MNTKQDFDTAWKEGYGMLNPEQKQAVDTIDGPVMVVAGPGTGKTQILTLRIANILRSTDTEPENILALTFTEAATTNMRSRLARFVGTAAHRVKITTFHGFANEIIQGYSESFPHIIGSQPVTEIEQMQIIESILVQGEFDLLKPFGDNLYYAKALRSAISELKREGVDEKEFASLVEKEKERFHAIPDLYYDKGAHEGKMKGAYKKEEKRLSKNTELVLIYEEYQKALRKQKRYDFSDMLVELLKSLRGNEDLKLQLQEQYQYILVDEHQDSNNAQNKILEQLMDFHDHPNIFVVGDEKQAIFRFQGASLENFYYFKEKYPEAALITLKQNYRSTQNILSSADSLLAGEAALQANTSYQDRLIQVHELNQSEEEIFFVAMDIKEKIASGVLPKEIAVLYRNNKDVFALADMCDRIGVSYVIESDQDILRHPVAHKFLTLLKGVVHYGDDAMLSRMLHLDIIELDHLDTFKLIRSASQKRKYQLYDLLRDPKLRKDLNLANEDAVLACYANLEHWVSLGHNDDARIAASTILRTSGLLQQVLGSDKAQEGVLVIRKIITLIEELAAGGEYFTLRDFIGQLATIEDHNISIRMNHTARDGRVRFMTAHRSKGLEFSYVYIMRANAGRFGAQKKRELLPLIPSVYQLSKTGDVLGGDQDDERRLFYVALTRAKEHVIVSYALHDEAGKEVLPSPFLQEINQEFLEYMDSTAVEERYRDTHGLLANEVSDLSVLRIEDQEYISGLFRKTGLSVSALNNYLKSPWQYFYRNLLRIPEPPNKHQAYGIAVHAALHDFFEALKHEGTLPSADFLTKRFVLSLDTQKYLSEEEYAEAKARGEVNLVYWYEEYHNTFVAETLNEFRIPAVYLDEHIRLTGVLDKVELISENEVHVVDYKTGKPKTRNDILGETKNSTGDYYRQLVFYKLLLRYWQEGRYTMKSGEIMFVEPDANGNFRREVFEVSDEEVDALELEIRRVAEEITELSFWNTACDPEQCNYCDLVEVLQKKA